jgi:xanthine/uracil permease
MTGFLFFITWIFLSCMVALFASQRRGRNGIGWGWLALFISPVLAGIWVAILPPKLPVINVSQFGYHAVEQALQPKPEPFNPWIAAVMIVIVLTALYYVRSFT